MRTAARFLAILFLFGAIAGTVYWLVTGEIVGAILLWSFSLTPGIVVAYVVGLHVTGRGVEPREQVSTNDVEHVSATVWPIFIVLGVIVVGAGLIYGLILLAPGIPLLAWSIAGFVREGGK